MVLGIGEASLELLLDRANFTQGETITGRIRLKINEPSEARELRVEFYGETGSGKHRRRVHYQKQQLSGSRTYRTGEEIPFSIQLPSNIYPASFPQGFWGSVQHLFTAEPRFYVHASLDLPGKMDAFRITQVFIPKPPR